MARNVRDASLETRAARSRLKPSGKPYFRSIEPGLHLGYRKPSKGAGRWVLRHYRGNGSYELETVGTADDFSDADGVAILSYWEAQSFARQRMVARAHLAAGKTTRLTVRDVVESYLVWMEGNRRSGVDARKRAEAVILPALGDIKVDKLTTDRICEWHLSLTKKAPRARTGRGKEQRYRKLGQDEEYQRRRKSTANRTLTTLKAALNRAWREGKIQSAEAWRRVQPFHGVDSARIRYLSVSEAIRLIEATSGTFRDLVEAALQTGARYGELSRLTVADFNREAGTLAIRISKSGKPRHVVLTDEGVALFERLVRDKSSNSLILLKAANEPWQQSDQIRPMLAACNSAGLEPLISFHGLRHTWASLAVMNGVPLMVVAKNLGHADTRMVEKHYGHLAPSYIAEAIRANAPRFSSAKKAA